MFTKVFTVNDEELKILFRIPFTMYFLGKERWRVRNMVKGRGKKFNEWSKLYLYRKEWDGDAYYFVRV